MPIEKLNLGPTPHLIVSCQADLDVRGSDREDTRLESDTPPLEVTPSEGGIAVNSLGDCIIRMPRGGSLDIREVLGSLRIKEVSGSITIGSVRGSCYVRQIQSMRLLSALGEVRIREVQGSISLDTVSGSLTLRDVAGPISIGEVRGEFLARNVPAGIEIGHIKGNLALRTTFNPETVSRFTVGGSATFHLSTEASVRFLIPLGQPVHLDRCLTPVVEGEQQVVTVGAGQAIVHVSALGGVWIRLHGDFDMDGDTAFALAAVADVTEHLAELTAELEAQTNLLSSHSTGISDRVRRQVEQRLSAARRQVEAAQRRVEREIGRASRDFGRRGLSISMKIEGERGQEAEPASEQERLLILQMLEQGKITVEQAQELLAALENRG